MGLFRRGQIRRPFYLVNDHFGQLIDFIRRCHSGEVLFQVCGGNIVVITLEVSNHLK